MDYLKLCKKRRNKKEMKLFIKDVEKLRYLYKKGSCDNMLKHISNIKTKYQIESNFWKDLSISNPITIKDFYINAEQHLERKSVELLLKYGLFKK